ncbi:MAG: LamG domain-containing protein, partial [Verrucomicrobia bacterium]|nr:LamG domain-containing protein [Verrucomicrobiota bacterium]
NGATALVLGTAYHVVYTYDGSKVRLYVNGVLDASADVAIYQPASTSQPGFTIGSRNGVTPAPSFIQDVALYTRALTQTEIQNHYQSTSGGGYASWQTTNGTSQGLDGDHDNDGVPNGIEYFLGGNTNTTGFTALPGVSNSGGTLSVTWTKSADYTGAYGTDFVVETSAALTGDWAPEALSPAGNVTITGNDVSYTFPTPLGARKFARLKVTGP